IGMTPGQVVTMVVASMVSLGLLGGILGAPLGLAVHHWVLPAMAAGAGTGLPASILHVYTAPVVALVVLAGVAIAVLGALVPAGWAARMRPADVLRGE